MGTPYEDVYSRFLSNITDYSLADMFTGDLETLMFGYMISSITDFESCKKDLQLRDDDVQEFGEDLDDKEIEILALLMVSRWIRPKLYTADLMKQSLPSRDYRSYSQANHIKELREMYKEARQDANRQITNYSYTRNDIEDLK